MTLQVGIVGIGYGQHVLLPVFRADVRSEVLALCASSQERARSVADEHGVERAYGDWREMIADPDIHIVAIATPPPLQPEIAIAAAQAGKSLFLEKPLAATLADASAMTDAIEDVHAYNVVDMEFPEIAAWQVARQILHRGGVGELRHVELVWDVENYANRNRTTNWKAEFGVGGVLFSYVSHVFYNLEWFVGKRITRLSARLTKAPSDPRNGDSINVITVEFENGLVASVTVSAHAFMGSGHRWAFYGDDGTLVLENTTRDYVYGFTVQHATRADKAFQQVPLPAEDTSVDGRRLAAGRIADKLLSWMTGGEPARPSVADGLRVQQLLAAAQQSNEEACWVDV